MAATKLFPAQVARRLSKPQRRQLLSLFAGTNDGPHWGQPNSGCLASAWWRTFNSLKNRAEPLVQGNASRDARCEVTRWGANVAQHVSTHGANLAAWTAARR